MYFVCHFFLFFGLTWGGVRPNKFKRQPEVYCIDHGCICGDGTVRCTNLNPSSLDTAILEIILKAESVEFVDCNQEELDLSFLSNNTNLRSILIRNCGVKYVKNSGILSNLTHLNLIDNEIGDWKSINNFLETSKSLISLDLSFNLLKTLELDINNVPSLRTLNLSHNLIERILVVPRVNILDLSYNNLINVPNIYPPTITVLNLSSNPLRHQESLTASELVNLRLNFCGLKILPKLFTPKLRELSLLKTDLQTIDFDEIHSSSLKDVNILQNNELNVILGYLPKKMQIFRLADTQVATLPNNFFSRCRNLKKLDISRNPWDCDQCVLQWMNSLPETLKPEVNCSMATPLHQCSIGISKLNDGLIVRAKVDDYAILPCRSYGVPKPSIEWWLRWPKTLIGTYNPINKEIKLNWSRNNTYSIIPGGYLLINNAQRKLVERYECVASNINGVSSISVRFRLDFSNWYRLDIFNSVFWGSVFASIFVCIATLVLNIFWIIIRHAGLWWIKRSERLSRVRGMVEAMEKYRQRQMSNLHEGYQRKMIQVRENYHQQVEQLRSSYAAQSGRFRDYRTAQLETMNQHIESLRDSYNQQKLRLREYGSRRAEQLWESYERQLNRIRTFSLQQRLRLMRTYKVKQRYMNKLFEKFSDDPNAEYIKTHPVLEPLHELETEVRLRHSASFCSLPDYLLHEEIGADIETFLPPTADKPHKCDTSCEDGPCTSQQAHRREQKKKASDSELLNETINMRRYPSANHLPMEPRYASHRFD